MRNLQSLGTPLRAGVRKTWKWAGFPYLQRLRFTRKLHRAVPVLIYQMGKVGSNSIYRSLANVYNGAVVHTHDFSAACPLWKVQQVRQWWRNAQQPLNVISLVREPVGRNVSAFFQNLDRYVDSPTLPQPFALADLRGRFLTRFPQSDSLCWFEHHFEHHFDLNVYDLPFPKCGFAFYSGKKVRLLIMKVEIPDEDKVQAVKSFLELPHFLLVNHHLSENKSYGSIYRQFKDTVKLPTTYVDDLCQSKYFRHFYDEQMKDQLLQKWC